jgi:hypothetical protein
VENCFVTLTYSQEAIEELKTGSCLSPVRLTNFLKRLRKQTEARGIRFKYFAVGEYGERTWRPHYHLNLFGLSMLHEELITRAWSFRGRPIGHCHVVPFSTATARYVTGYILKRMERQTEARELGRTLEFRRMSKGLGLAGVPYLARSIRQSVPNLDTIRQSPPMFIRVRGRKKALGRYIAGKLAEELGIEEAWVERKQAYMEELNEELFTLRVDFPTITPREAFEQRRAGVVSQIEGKTKALSMRRTI